MVRSGWSPGLRESDHAPVQNTKPGGHPPIAERKTMTTDMDEIDDQITQTEQARADLIARACCGDPFLAERAFGELLMGGILDSLTDGEREKLEERMGDGLQGEPL